MESHFEDFFLPHYITSQAFSRLLRP
uniref:Uncharacterized protein n=1 Tax=Anguilla anguilla TaxID=7936 RepID=A0A0E9W5W3_ANGAN